MNKKGDTLVFEIVIFIVLNLIFFVALFTFVWQSSKGALVYEQVYAKQIALLIDEAKSNTLIQVDLSDGARIAKSNKIDPNGIVSIDQNQKRVKVSLTGTGGYSFQYFNDYPLEVTIVQEGKLRIIVKEK